MDQSFSPDTVGRIFYQCVEDCFEPIMITDANGLLRYVNPSWTLTYGYAREEVLGHTPRLLRSPHQDDQFYKKMWKTILDPEVGFWRGEVLNVAKDGHVVPVLLTITPYRSADGTPVGYMGIAVDLSDHKRMEQQILQQDRLASIGMLAGGLAHEIGNPIGVIRGRAELLASQVRDQPEAEKNIGIIIGQIDRIAAMIQSLLRVTRAPDHALLREVQLSSVVDEVAIFMAESCRRSNIELKLQNLDFKVFAEPSYIQQVLLNLVINSTHAIEELRSLLESSSREHLGSHSISISACLVNNGSYCAVTVSDSGIGIGEENVKSIFNPFFTTKSTSKGTGMGLAIVAKLLEEMEGSVTAHSEGKGKGAQITFMLKVRPDANDQLSDL